MSTVDFNKPPAGHDYTATVKPAETEGERRVRLFKDVALFLTALGFVLVIGWLCVDTLRAASSSDEEKKWAMSILSAVAAGIIGYLVRK